MYACELGGSFAGGSPCLANNYQISCSHHDAHNLGGDDEDVDDNGNDYFAEKKK